jgi:sugar/nucleoside kinase (ribokinase family)
MADPATQKIEKLSKPLDYLIIGHVTTDLTDEGPKLGGTVTFSGMTAQALGLKTGIITAFNPETDISPLHGLWIKNKISSETTTFKNISDGIKRTQYLYHKADDLTTADVPTFTPPPAILHLGPVDDEVSPDILAQFPDSLKCLTPQGWFRKVSDQGHVIQKDWKKAAAILSQSDAAVISLEDVQYDEETIARMAAAIPVFVVTENYKGARVYWHNDARYIKAPKVKLVDDTGSGDIFATAFFYRYWKTKDPWEAGRFAVLIASWSVSCHRLKSVPTKVEIERAKTEVL